MRNYKILKFTRAILNIFWYLQIVIIALIIVIGFLLYYNIDIIDLNHLKGFNISFKKITFVEPLIYNGDNYAYSLTNGKGRLHITDLDQKFIYLRMLAAMVDSLIYLIIIYFLRRIFKNLTDNNYFISANGLYIRKISLFIILMSFVAQLIQYAADLWIKNTLVFESIIIKNEFNFRFQTILLGLLVYVISIVFLRGVELQKDKDLTI
ncbi:DUF2975 domain-containing protein [Gelidibacter sp.]|uniref:DUF2975 domain-containing protein n=1 Tax=Gelidibacter sp. TaxID=2018083 RepID=UPI002C25A849|nr:DUF2975 domain-containing protein [Gelidibacter sp.]HUH28580.1 DUF2975 domain-containing protein [Gelidibacter sp.]